MYRASLMRDTATLLTPPQEGRLFSLDDMIQFLPPLLHGALLTIGVSLLAFCLALLCGLATGIARMSRLWPLRVVAAVYIQFIRGTPLLLQLFFIYYVLLMSA